VWDSVWLPAVVIEASPRDRVVVKLAHGVAFTVTTRNLIARDPARNGRDIPPAKR
jgi:hypothetical protein